MEVIDNLQKRENPMSVSDWFITLLIAAIPVVGFIMLFVWAFGDSTPKTKSNWAKANLIFMVIAVVLVGIFFMLFGLGALLSDNLE